MKPDTKVIRARADAASEGPWASTPLGMGTLVGTRGPNGVGNVAVVYGGGANTRSEADTAFIAAARADVPALCDRIEALERALEVIGGRLLGEVTRMQLLDDVRAALEGT